MNDDRANRPCPHIKVQGIIVAGIGTTSTRNPTRQQQASLRVAERFQGTCAVSRKTGCPQTSAQDPQNVHAPALKSSIGVPAGPSKRIPSGQTSIQALQEVQCARTAVSLVQGGLCTPFLHPPELFWENFQISGERARVQIQFERTALDWFDAPQSANLVWVLRRWHQCAAMTADTIKHCRLHTCVSRTTPRQLHSIKI